MQTGDKDPKAETGYSGASADCMWSWGCSTGRPMPLAADYSTIGGFPVQWLTFNVDVTLTET